MTVKEREAFLTRVRIWQPNSAMGSLVDLHHVSHVCSIGGSSNFWLIYGSLGASVSQDVLLDVLLRTRSGHGSAIVDGLMIMIVRLARQVQQHRRKPFHRMETIARGHPRRLSMMYLSGL